MKTPKQEADELISLFYGVVDKEIDSGQLVPKTCALVVVDKILDEHLFDDCEYSNRRYEYWQKVKEEILKG